MKDSSAVGERTDESLDQLLTEPTNSALLGTILRHPRLLPSRYELRVRTPEADEEAVDDALETLLDAGVVAERRLPEGERRPGCPDTFYGLTEDGRQALEATGLLSSAERRDGADVSDVARSVELVKHENAPRPSVP